MTSRTRGIALLVASTGGHLAQLHRLRQRIPALAGRRVRWITFDTPQSRSLLKDEDVVFASFTAPRDIRAVLRNTPLARRLMRPDEVDLVVSTGSGIALSFLPVARMRRIPCHYIESAARSKGPSVTGRILSRAPGVRTYSQYPGWARGRWRYAGSVFQGFDGCERNPEPERPYRVVVTLGTIPYPFSRLLERLAEMMPTGTEVLWQTGCTETSELGIDSTPELPMQELMAAMRNSDVVIAHSGIGSALAALEAGRQPILVPREAGYGEHVDEHQRLIAEDLAERGLAIHRTVEDLTWEDVRWASGRWVSRSADPPPFELID